MKITKCHISDATWSIPTHPERELLVRALMAGAIEKKATAIHLGNGQVKVRCGEELVLLEWDESLPKKGEKILLGSVGDITSTGTWNGEIINHVINILRTGREGNKENISGSFTLAMEEETYHVRFIITAAIGGRHAVLQITRTDAKREKPEVAEIFGKEAWDKALKALGEKSGLFIINGPTGSGKTFVLSELIEAAHAKNPGKAFTTIECPVEIKHSFARQVEVTNASGQTYASMIQRALRMDLDYLMIGEILDKETSQAAIQAALTGHIVLGTMHTTGGTSILERLSQSSNAKFLTEVLKGHFTVRLLPKLCTKCRIAMKSDSQELGITGKDEESKIIYQQGKGCNSCKNGAAGQTMLGVYYDIDEETRERNSKAEKEGVEQNSGKSCLGYTKKKILERIKALTVSGNISFEAYKDLCNQVETERLR